MTVSTLEELGRRIEALERNSDQLLPYEAMYRHQEGVVDGLAIALAEARNLSNRVSSHHVVEALDTLCSSLMAYREIAYEKMQEYYARKVQDQPMPPGSSPPPPPPPLSKPEEHLITLESNEPEPVPEPATETYVLWSDYKHWKETEPHSGETLWFSPIRAIAHRPDDPLPVDKPVRVVRHSALDEELWVVRTIVEHNGISSERIAYGPTPADAMAFAKAGTKEK